MLLCVDSKMYMSDSVSLQRRFINKSSPAAYSDQVWIVVNKYCQALRGYSKQTHDMLLLTKINKKWFCGNVDILNETPASGWINSFQLWKAGCRLLNLYLKHAHKCWEMEIEQKVISDLLEPGGQRGLTRKRRRERRCRRWGRGWGRRLPSAGPSSPVRRSRTCSCRAASPIFAPFAWSSPPTCCPLVSPTLD